LIEYKGIDGNGLFIIHDGADKGDIYTPKTGDLIINLDKKIDLLTPLVKNVKTKLVYKHEPSDGTGIILRISKSYQQLISNVIPLRKKLFYTSIKKLFRPSLSRSISNKLLAAARHRKLQNRHSEP
jgi:hypothetical protein